MRLWRLEDARLLMQTFERVEATRTIRRLVRTIEDKTFFLSHEKSQKPRHFRLTDEILRRKQCCNERGRRQRRHRERRKCLRGRNRFSRSHSWFIFGIFISFFFCWKPGWWWRFERRRQVPFCKQSVLFPGKMAIRDVGCKKISYCAYLWTNLEKIFHTNFRHHHGSLDLEFSFVNGFSLLSISF